MNPTVNRRDYDPAPPDPPMVLNPFTDTYQPQTLTWWQKGCRPIPCGDFPGGFNILSAFWLGSAPTA